MSKDKIIELEELEQEAEALMKKGEEDITDAKDAIDHEVKKVVKELARVKAETSEALDSLKNLSPEERQAKAKKIVESAVEKMNKATDQVKLSVLGEDKKFDATDIKRLANDGIHFGAKALGEVAKGINWLKDQLEKTEIK